MKYESYEKIMASFRAHPRSITFLTVLNYILSGAAFILYPILLIQTAIGESFMVLYYLFIPAICFVVLSAVRRRINKKRPYETYDITPLIKRDGKGKSFPSRHVYSIMLIASLWFHLSVPVAVVLLVFGVFLAILRVISGIHYPIDVVCGAIFGILSGLLTILIAGF